MGSPTAPAPTPISVSVSLTYANPPSQSQVLTIPNKRLSIMGKHFVAGTMSVPTTPGGTLIPVGILASLGWAAFVNNDPTNGVDILTGLSGLDFIHLEPGAPTVFKFGAGITAPALVANGAPCDVEYLILEA